MIDLRLSWATTLCLVLLLGSVTPLAAQSPEQLNRQGLDYLRQQQPGLAVEMFQRALRQRPDHPRLRQNLATACLASGKAALNELDYERALEWFNKGRECSDEPSEFLFHAGTVHLRKGDLSQAEIALNASLALAPERAETHQLLGRLYYGSGRMPEAMVSLRRAGELQPDDASIRAFIARVQTEYALEMDMSQAHDGHFRVYYIGNDNPTLGEDVLRVLAAAYVEVGHRLNRFPSSPVPVLLYNQQNFAAITSSPGWVGGLYDGKIRVLLGQIRQLDDPLRALLFHEYSHVVIRDLTRGYCPAWLHEGLAEIFGRSRHNPPLRRFPEAAKQGQLLDFKRLEGNLVTLSSDDAHLAYEQSFHFVRYLIELFGWTGIHELLRAFAAGDDTQAAFVRVFGEYGHDFDSLLRQWQALAMTE